MKCLIFADIHNDKKAMEDLVLRAKENDINFMICAGDLSNFGTGLHAMLKLIDSVNKPCYIIPGNHEGDETLTKALKKYSKIKNIHKQAVELDGYILLGYGDGGFSKEDLEFRKLSRQWYGKYNGKKIILLTHGPPYGTEIDYLHKSHVGNLDYRKFIDRIKPKVVVCGHIHETAGIITELKETKIINPGWDGMVITLS